MVASPVNGISSPAMVLIRVDLPAPFWPSKPIRWPICSENLMPLTMVLCVISPVASFSIL
ncbi:hypothetical protein D3C72_2142450 [compost metagenome]